MDRYWEARRTVASVVTGAKTPEREGHGEGHLVDFKDVLVNYQTTEEALTQAKTDEEMQVTVKSFT